MTYFKLTQGIAMGLNFSSTVAEIYLKYVEELMVKHWMEMCEIMYYKRYVDDIIIIFDQNKTDEDTITNHMNNIHRYLEFKLNSSRI
jgi:hypothetical protein